jgi:hypothetical protein
VDGARGDTAGAARAEARVLQRVRRGAIPLSAADLGTISRFHATFVSQGPALRFNTTGRAPQPYYPDLRRLLIETDRAGRQSNFLAHESDFQVVKSLEDRNLIVPVVGDFGDATALPGVAQWIRTAHESVSAFYTSNVEQYLFIDRTFGQFARNVAEFPRTAHSVMIRSYFQGMHPQQVAGYHATQVAQLMDRFVAVESAGGFLSYYALVTQDLVTPP